MSTAHDDDRLAQLEQLLARQQEELHELKAALAEASAEQAQPARIGRWRSGVQRVKSSRRTLLKLGGVAAAGVAGALLSEQSGTVQAAPAHHDAITFHQTAVNSGNVAIEGDGTLGAQGVIGTSDNSIGVQGQSTTFTGVFGQSGSGTGVQGQSSSGFGVLGTSGSTGVAGTSSSGTGVAGTSTTSGTGVLGTSNSGKGVAGTSTSGTAVAGTSGSGYGGVFTGGLAPLQLGLGGATGAPTTGTHAVGDLYLDSAATMWVCVAPGTPGTWKQVVVVPSSPTVTLQQSASGLGDTAIAGGGTGGADGVHGTSDSGVAVSGNSTSGFGVVGASTNSAGVTGSSTSNFGGVFSGGRAPLMLGLGGAPGAPTTGMHSQGEIYLDSAATVFVCTALGTPGTWVRVGTVASGAVGGAITYLSKPVRLLDTRAGAVDALNTPGAPYAGGSTHSLTIAGVSYNGVTVPASCVGAIGNVTVVGGSSGGGYVSLVPQGAGFSGTSNVNFVANQVDSNFYNVGLVSGQVDIIVGVNVTDVILDVFAVVS